MEPTEVEIEAKASELNGIYWRNPADGWQEVARHVLPQRQARPEDVEEVESVVRKGVDDWCASDHHESTPYIARAIIARYGAPPAATLPIGTIRLGEGLTAAQEAMVGFYEREFYPLSNFSAFTLMWGVSPREGLQRFDTSEAVYHWEKFRGNVPTQKQRDIMAAIRSAPSAHEAFKIAERNKEHRRPKWDEEKVGVMLRIIRAKAEQHEYVRRKLLETGDRHLVEDSWRDDFWGWGPNKNGHNQLGKLWMVIRDELRASAAPKPVVVENFSVMQSDVSGMVMLDKTAYGNRLAPDQARALAAALIAQANAAEGV